MILIFLRSRREQGGETSQQTQEYFSPYSQDPIISTEIIVKPRERKPIGSEGSPAQRKIDNQQDLLQILKPYATPSIKSSLWQTFNTFIPLFANYYLMYLSLSYSYWLTLALALLAAGFTVRLFIIQHDCGHMAFFPSRTWNDRLGYVCSLFTMVPYFYWKRQHALHHSTNGNLDKRGIGDMDVFTVEEYLAMNKWQRFRYRAYRNPLVFLFIGPLVLFFVINRHWADPVQYSARDKRNVWLTNLTIAVTFGGLGWLIGYGALLKIALPVLYLAAGAGIWLFYIQHQFEHTYWKPDQEWNFVRAAMQGSSFYRLPKILQWFTGNIGFHHIHHLTPGIPNYRLETIYNENPEFRDVYEVTILSSLKTMFLSVWDAKQQRLISFRELNKKYA